MPFCLQMWNFSFKWVIISLHAIFDNAFGPRTHISAHSGKTGSRSWNLTGPRWKRTQCSTFWFLFELSTMNIKDSTCSRNIVNFRHVMWPLTLMFDLYRKCLYKLSMRDASIIHMQCLVTLGRKMYKIADFREFANFVSHSTATREIYRNARQ